MGKRIKNILISTLLISVVLFCFIEGVLITLELSSQLINGALFNITDTIILAVVLVISFAFSLLTFKKQ